MRNDIKLNILSIKIHIGSCVIIEKQSLCDSLLIGFITDISNVKLSWGITFFALEFIIGIRRFGPFQIKLRMLLYFPRHFSTKTKRSYFTFLNIEICRCWIKVPKKLLWRVRWQKSYCDTIM